MTYDGALLVSDDGNGTIWRIAYRGGTNELNAPAKAESPAADL
jgi:hypothetical protein